MPFPFGKSHKSPADIVKHLKDSMTVLEKHDISDKKAEKVRQNFNLFSSCKIYYLKKKTTNNAQPLGATSGSAIKIRMVMKV